MVEMKCQNCGVDYELTESEFEERAEQKLPDLCPTCLGMIEMQAKKIAEPCFEYKIVSINEFRFNQLGQDGWELIAVNNSQGHFKRKYFREVLDDNANLSKM